MQSDVRNFADDLITAVADTYGDVESRADTAAKRSFVQTQKVEIASSALENAVNVHPFGGLMDTVVLITLVRECNEDPATREILGTDYPVIERMLVMQEATAWRLAGRYLSDDRLAELRRDIAAWRAANPQQRYVAHVHLIDFLIANPNLGQTQARNPGSIFALLFIDPLSGIDPAVREIEQSRDTAERMFFYLQRLPLLISWRVEIQYQQILGTPQVGQALGDVTSLTASSDRFVNVAADIAKSVEAFRTQISKEREEAIDQLTRATTTVSDAAITRATTQLSAERSEAIAQLSASAHAEEEALVKNTNVALNNSIDRFYERLQWVLIVTIGVFFGGLVLYRVVVWRMGGTEKQWHWKCHRRWVFVGGCVRGNERFEEHGHRR